MKTLDVSFCLACLKSCNSTMGNIVFCFKMEQKYLFLTASDILAPTLRCTSALKKKKSKKRNKKKPHQAFGTGKLENTVADQVFLHALKSSGFQSTLETQETMISEEEVGIEDIFSL